ARNTIDQNLFSDRISRSAEATLPESMCEQDNLFSAGNIFRFRKIASQLRRSTENVEKIPGDASGDDPFRRGFAAAARAIDIVATKQCDVGETALGRAPVEIIRITDRAGVECFTPLAQQYQPLRVGIRQRTQKQRVNDTKNRGVGADAKRERQRGDQGEAGMLR